MAPFFRAAKYMIDPFFRQKVYDWPHFSGWVCERPHFSDVSRYMQIFFVQRFFKAACSLVIQWIDCYICLTTSNKCVQKIKGQYMNGSVLLKARYMNGVGFEILVRTPAPQLPSPPPPHPRGWITSPDFEYRGSCQHFSLISTDTNLQCYVNWFSATTSGRSSYDFLFTTRCCACGDKQSCYTGMFLPAKRNSMRAAKKQISL